MIVLTMAHDGENGIDHKITDWIDDHDGIDHKGVDWVSIMVMRI